MQLGSLSCWYKCWLLYRWSESVPRSSKRRIPITGLSECPTALERSKTRYCLGVMTSAVVPFLPYFPELCRECLQPCLPASWLNSKLASAGSCMWLVSERGRWLKRRECCIWKAAWGGSSEWSGNTIWESGSPAAARCVRPTVWMVKSAKTAPCLLL